MQIIHAAYSILDKTIYVMILVLLKSLLSEDYIYGKLLNGYYNRDPKGV